MDEVRLEALLYEDENMQVGNMKRRGMRKRLSSNNCCGIYVRWD